MHIFLYSQKRKTEWCNIILTSLTKMQNLFFLPRTIYFSLVLVKYWVINIPASFRSGPLIQTRSYDPNNRIRNSVVSSSLNSCFFYHKIGLIHNVTQLAATVLPLRPSPSSHPLIEFYCFLAIRTLV